MPESSDLIKHAQVYAPGGQRAQKIARLIHDAPPMKPSQVAQLHRLLDTIELLPEKKASNA